MKCFVGISDVTHPGPCAKEVILGAAKLINFRFVVVVFNSFSPDSTPIYFYLFVLKNITPVFQIT